MKTEYRIIWPDGRIEQHEIELPDADGSTKMLRALKAIIEDGVLGGGAYMEHVRVFWDFDGGNDPKYLDMFVDEDGLGKGLPVNRAATRIYDENVRRHVGGLSGGSSVIVGPAVLFRDIVWT